MPQKKKIPHRYVGFRMPQSTYDQVRQIADLRHVDTSAVLNWVLATGVPKLLEYVRKEDTQDWEPNHAESPPEC